MAKELPYFQFEPAEYLTKDISFCSLSAQGLFINLCSYYWQRECKLTTSQLLRRLNHEKELKELITEKVISVKENAISVKFLDEQYKKSTIKRNTNKINGSKGGRPKKINPNETQTKPKRNPNESESKGIREDKIKEHKINNNKKIDNTNFKNDCISDVQFMEVTAMQTKQSLPSVLKYLNTYENRLIQLGEQKKDLKDYKHHFTNWLNKQDLKPCVVNKNKIERWI